MAPPSGMSSSAATPGDMLTPLMALDITEQPTANTRTSPSSAMVRTNQSQFLAKECAQYWLTA